MTNSPEFKRCSRCREMKPVEDFYRMRKARDGRQGYCKECSGRDQRERAQRNPRVIAVREPAPPGMKQCLDCKKILDIQYFPRFARRRDGRHSYCKRCFAARTTASAIKVHGSTRDMHLKRRYGLTAAEVDRMIASQGGVCAVCRSRTPEHVDHDHRTGKIRGILCSLCNQGLGNFDDDVEVMAAAIEYVRLHRDDGTNVVPLDPSPARVTRGVERSSVIEDALRRVTCTGPRVVSTSATHAARSPSAEPATAGEPTVGG